MNLRRTAVKIGYFTMLVTIIAIVGTVFFTGLGSYFRMHPEEGPARSETKVAEERKPAVPAPASTSTPAPVPSTSNTEKDKEIEALRKRNAELEGKLKAAPTQTKSQDWGEWFSSWRSFQLPSAPSFTPAPTTAAPAPSIAAPPTTIDAPKSSLDKTIIEIQEKIAGKRVESTPTPSPSSLPSVPPPPKAASTPAAKTENSFFTFPTLPSPPSIKSVSLKGPSASSGGFFSGGCSARGEEVDLSTIKDNGGWLTLTDNSSKGCIVVFDYDRSAIITANDGRGDFELKVGVGRNPTRVSLVAGRGYFKYSLCDKSNVPPGGRLNWDCTVY